jgi:Protein of unknown function (DUF3300)
MKTRKMKLRTGATVTLLALLSVSMPGRAQVPVDEEGMPVGDGTAALGDEGLPLRSPGELETLVGPVALYPDDLLAIVLPATTYPLQVVEAARFLEDLETNSALEPDEDWDDSIVALVNYPEVVALLNEDLDWTWQLGEAVVAQQADVIQAIAAFRDRAHAAGNLKSDEYQTVARNEEIIEITPVSEEVIYVPYYEPERVVVYQPRQVYYYYPRAYPVYYYPYPSYYAYGWNHFWGVTTAFAVGWQSHCLSVYHPSYYGHPYYGYSYGNSWWYRSPSVTVYNNDYYDQRQVHNRYSDGDRWRSRATARLHYDDQRITRNRYYPNPATAGAAHPQSRSVDVNGRVGRGNPPAVQAARTNGSAAGSRRAGDMREIRQALNDTGTSPGRVAVQAPRTPASGTPRPTRDSVGEMRDALAANREARTVPARRGAITAERSALTTPRPTVPAARQAIPAQRPDVTGSSGTRRSVTVAPARSPAATAPAVRQSRESQSRESAPSRPSAPAARQSAPSAAREAAPARAATQRSASPARERSSRTR